MFQSGRTDKRADIPPRAQVPLAYVRRRLPCGGSSEGQIRRENAITRYFNVIGDRWKIVLTVIVNGMLQTVGRISKAQKCEPVELFLFPADRTAKALSLLNARFVDLWKAADQPTKQKAIRILSDLL